MDHKKTTTTHPQNDPNIWDSFRQGSEIAFKTLHQEYYNDLYAYALKMTNDKYIAKNAIQELFVYLWKSKDNLSPVHHIRYYLIFSLRRHIIRILKKEQKHQHQSLQSDAEAFFFTFSPEDILIQKESDIFNAKSVVEALNQLPPRQREIVYLRYFQDVNMDEIAQMLSISYQSLLNAQCRAMKNLRKLMLNQKQLEQFFIILLLADLNFIF